MTSMLDELDSMSEEKHMEICHKADELQKKNLGRMSNRMTNHTELKKSGNFLTDHTKLSDEEKAFAEKVTKLIARDYGEVIKKLGEE